MSYGSASRGSGGGDEWYAWTVGMGPFMVPPPNSANTDYLNAVLQFKQAQEADRAASYDVLRHQVIPNPLILLLEDV